MGWFHSDDWFHPTRLVEYWFFLVPALLGLAVLASWWIDRRAVARREAELARLCQGNRAHVENLVSLEMASRPGVTRAIARERLITRLRGSSR